MSKTDIETLVTSSFSKCPFCSVKGSMEFEWGHSIPRSMTCQECKAKWELLFGLNKNWKFLGAKLVGTGSTKKGTKLVGKFYDRKFWEKVTPNGVSEKRITLEKTRTPGVAERTIIIREIVKVRCPYCGGLYDEVKDRSIDF